jgi:hypothetical protein
VGLAAARDARPSPGNGSGSGGEFGQDAGVPRSPSTYGYHCDITHEVRSNTLGQPSASKTLPIVGWAARAPSEAKSGALRSHGPTRSSYETIETRCSASL